MLAIMEVLSLGFIAVMKGTTLEAERTSIQDAL